MEIKNRFTNEVIYSCTAKTIKEAVEQAVKEFSNLKFADLRFANLRNVNLENANLGFANLQNVNLGFANLQNVNLENVNLENADLKFVNLENVNLKFANLENANLGFANLQNVNLENADLQKTIKLPMYCKWSHGITNGKLIHIGCEKRTIEDWDKFFNSDEKISTERGTVEFKQIQAVYEAYKAYLTFLNK